MTKMTYSNALTIALDNLTTLDVDIEVIEKLTALRDQLEKKASTSHKPTKTQLENEGIKARICEYLTHTLLGLQAKDIAKELDLSSVQKASTLLCQLVKEGKVEKVEGEKRVTLFKLVDTDPDQYLPHEVSC